MHKESTIRYFIFSLNDYIICEICNEQGHKESKLKYLVFRLNDYVKSDMNKCTKNQQLDISH